MPNELTGDFDVVAQFAVPAANRILAAMHQVGRFPHAMSLRVKDIPPLRPFPGLAPAVVATIDSFGDPVSNPGRIADDYQHPGIMASTDAIHFNLDPIVNLGNAGILVQPLEPSNLKGRAQLQLFPPTVEIPDDSGTNLTVHLQLLSHYLPDKDTSPAAEFIRGDLRITAPVHQVASQVANMVEIDIKASAVGINFVPQSSSTPLTAEDLSAIHLLIRNALRTAFLPSNSPLPPNIRHMQFRTIRGAHSVIAALLNLESGPGNRNSAGNVFLNAGDDFAFAVGADFVRSAFQPTLDKILSTQVQPVSFTLNGVVHTWHITYTIVLTSAAVELRNGAIVLTVKGRATTPSWTPNFDFTVTLKFSLEVSGDTAELVPGDVSIDTSSWIIDRFRGRMTSAIRSVRDRALSRSGALATVRRMMSASQNLGGFVGSLMKPAQTKPGTPPPPPAPAFAFAYSSAEIRPAGIVLHGALTVASWPPPHVEFEQIPSVGSDSVLGAAMTPVKQGPDYSALKTWIPGGTVRSYEWKYLGQSSPGLLEENKFIYRRLDPGLSAGIASTSLVSGFRPLCLTVHGSRLSAAGPVVSQTVTASVCGVNSFPFGDIADTELPAIAMVERSTNGLVNVVGHTAPPRASKRVASPNLLVHFGTDASAGELRVLMRALSESGRNDAPTAIIAVMSTDAIASMEFVDGVTYADDSDSSWPRRLGLRGVNHPSTVIVSPRGKVIWQIDGLVERRAFVEVLRKSLVTGDPVTPTLQRTALRLGHRPPNFLFEYAPGREVTLRKTAGRPITIVFWRSTSRQSVEMVRHLESIHEDHHDDRPLVLAVNDGESAEVARRAAQASRMSSIVVTDSARAISSAYGVNAWPTTIALDSAGAVRGIRFGRFAADIRHFPVDQETTDAARKRQ
ncbi:MAG TPA: TlpA disulfide reductase family protein [Gemmatimonadaceae bacterium]|nr:TlpA disulfide reductase family protein [Gemmatimonadaceae bacterium]